MVLGLRRYDVLKSIHQALMLQKKRCPVRRKKILTGHIKATDEQIVALASIPKEERSAILEELKKKRVTVMIRSSNV